ncbi:serine palmitoyltransferase 2-like, partial [Diaphorina citri]|uniref:Serine palmitoyltransferase 2-like n=1 Tax=Diaphorina citri TaxID=121845 RepID=A0A3Q0J927_DIACI
LIPQGYPDLYEKFVLFYSRYVYRRIVDCFNRPVTSVPGAIITIKDRETPDYGWTFKYTGTESTCLNLASYNYLGFGENTGLCTERSKESVKQSGCALCSPSGEIGTHKLHLEVEALTAQFLGVESCMVIGMGYASNKEATSVVEWVSHEACTTKRIMLLSSRDSKYRARQCVCFDIISTIDYIRANSHVRSYATSMPPPVAMQILTSMRIIMGLENGDEGNVRHSSI